MNIPCPRGMHGKMLILGQTMKGTEIRVRQQCEVCGLVVVLRMIMEMEKEEC